jgi:hypothetical protein
VLRKPRNVLESIIFTDRKIVRHYPRGNDHFVEFLDYCENPMKIRFTETSRVEELADVSEREVMDVAFDRDDGGWTVIFKDDDGEPILVIGYRDAELV